MNIVNRLFLKLALLPLGLYRRMKINTVQLQAILITKLTMDDRRPNTLQQAQRKKKERPVTMATVGTMVMSALMGLLYLLAFVYGGDAVTSLTFYFTLFFFMLSATLISDFTSVLIDVRDSFIILPKPVNDQTFIVARLLHIFIHLCKIVFPMSLPGLVYVAVNFKLAGALLFLLMVLFVTAFAIFFINALYILILKFTTPQRFKAIISYMQIVFAIVFYSAFQLMPRMIDRFHLESFDITSVWGIRFFPIYWFACAWEVLRLFSGSFAEVLLTVMAFLLPVICLWVVVKYLAPAFNNKLAMINGSDDGSAAKRHSKQAVTNRSSYVKWLSNIFTKSPAEKTGFLLTWKLTSRSRDFKLKVYPSIGYLAVYVVIIFFNSKNFSVAAMRSSGTEGKLLIISALYFTSLILTMAISQIVFSDKYKAAWMYYITPLEAPGAVILGSAKAAIFKFYIPIVVFITAAALAFIGPAVMPNVVLGLFNELLIVTMMVYARKKMFPFSMHESNNVKAGSFLRNIGVLAVSGFIAVGHFLVYQITAVVLIGCLLSVTATWLLMSSIKNISWAAVKSSYADD